MSADGGIFRWKNPYCEKEAKEVKESCDVESIRSEPGEIKEAHAKPSEECITKTMKTRCKCGKANCKCPKMRITTTKCCKCSNSKCNCTVSVVKPIVKDVRSKEHVSKPCGKKVIRVPSSEYGKNNIYGDFCPMPGKDNKK